VLQGFLKITNGYFYDNVSGKAFVPHGIAYQTWNRPLGVWQSWEQFSFDLDEMVKMGANSIRIDIVWQHAEELGDNQFSWANYDYMVQECEKRDIRIFALIGYQWPPNWFPDSYYTMHPPETDAEGILHTNRWQSDIIGYETPGARAQYGEWISNVCARYKNSKAIAGWVVGNESGYLGLWSGLLDGYDTNCEAAFRRWVTNKYAVAGSVTTSDAPNLALNPGFETNGANWAVTGNPGVEDGFSAGAAETGSYGAWITNNAGDHYTYQVIPTNAWAANINSTFVYRVRARKAGTITGSIKLELYHPWVVTTNVDITASLTTNWQTFAMYYKPTAGADQTLELRVRNATGGSGTGQVQFDNAYFGITNIIVSGQPDVSGIAGANAAWGTSYTNINQVNFVDQYRAYGMEGAIWADMVTWREDSIADFTAVGAKAAKSADTNHLISYSTVGMQWGEEDWRYHAEDRGRITAKCALSNAPIDFFSVNNYPWSILGHESQNGQWGISYTKKVAKVPVVYSETGFTSSETMWPGMNELRQGPLVRNALWESLECGAIGTHVFSWMDRPWITDREKGFGIVYANRGIKPALYVVKNAYSLMDQMKIQDLLMGSQDPTPDIAFLWTDAVDSQHNRYECEMQQIAGALERLGYEPNFIKLAELGSGVYTNYKAIVLPRNMRVEAAVPNSTNKTVLDFLRQNVIGKGVHVVASADIPGLQDFNGKQRTNYVAEVQNLFGIDASDIGGFEAPQRRRSFVSSFWQQLSLKFTSSALGPLAGGYAYSPQVWKYSDEVTLGAGGVAWAHMDSGRNKGFEKSLTNVSPWSSWGTAYVTNRPSFAYAGTNALCLKGDAGVWSDFAAVPFGRYVHSSYLRSEPTNALAGDAYASVSLEWYNEAGGYLGVSESPLLTTTTGGGISTSEAPNLVINSGFETNGANWSVTGNLGVEDGFSAGAAETGSYGAWITNNAGDHYTYQQIPTNTWAPQYGSTFVYRVRAKKAGTITGSIKLELYHPWVTTTNIDITASLTTNWQTFALYYKPTAGADQVIELRLRNATGGSGTGQVLYDNAYYGITNMVVSSGNAWVKYSIDTQAPSNTYTGRRIIRIGHRNLLSNGCVTGSGTAPSGWQNWSDANHDAEYASYLGNSGNSWSFWADAGIYQEITNGFSVGNTIKYGGLLYTPSWDRLQGGTKNGTIELEFYNGGTIISTNKASPAIDQTSAQDAWLWSQGSATVPATCTKIRVVVRCNATGGSGRFFADDLYLRNDSTGSGSVYADNNTTNLAVAVKDHGTAKSAIFLYSAGDISPDSDGNGQADYVAWKWRFDLFGAVFKDYFGIQPKIAVTGTNAYLTLPEYRTTTNGSILIQMKNYAYDTNFYASWTNLGGGAPLTFAVTSSLLAGKTVVAYEQGKILATNCNGAFNVTLDPDGQDMILAYTPGSAAKQIIRISDAPPLVHPFGDKTFGVTVLYDTLNLTNAIVKCAFGEIGDNGDGITNEVYNLFATNAVAGSGKQVFWMYIPDVNPQDTDYKSTQDGGKYQFTAWLETNGAHVVDAFPAPVQLKWGAKPNSTWTNALTLGQTVTNNVKWEDLYELQWWQNTPIRRADTYPGRIALYRSSKTEKLFPGHFAKANEVANWLESLGYVNGEPQDVMFDNVTVAGVVTNNFDAGTATNWTRESGCGNWTVEDSSLTPAMLGSDITYDTFTTFILSQATRRVSFKVKADKSKNIAAIHLYMTKAAGTCPTYTIGLYNDDNGIPNIATPILTKDFTVATNAAHWEYIDLPDYAWQAGKCYHFGISYKSGTIGSTNQISVQYVRPALAPRNVLTSTNSGAAWTTTGYDPVFRVVYDDNTSFVQPYASQSALTVKSNTYYGQVFKPTQSMKITNILVFMRKESTANNADPALVVQTWTNRALMASASVARASIPTTNSWVAFNFPAGITVTNGGRYMFEMRNNITTGPTTGAYFVIRGNGLGNYGIYTWNSTNDFDVLSSNAGTTFTDEVHYDLAFKVATVSTGKALRAWRIGNDDNILVMGTQTYANGTFSTDIRYNKQGKYFNDAELFIHYKDRGNFYKVGIRNFYGFWRLRYFVLAGSNIFSQGWLYDFAKTNQPTENTWYNLKVTTASNTNQVYFNNVLVGTFYATNTPSGRVGVSSRAVQLGIWEPPQGYFFVDDDELSFYAPEGQPQTVGKMLNMDYGYLKGFYTTLILPSVYAMNDAEASNMVTWINSTGLYSIISMDGGVAKVNETGASDLGRVESLFGVAPAISTLSNITKATVGSDSHFVTVDYAAGAAITASGTAQAYSTLTTAQGLATISNATSSIKGLLANKTGPDTNAPTKIFAFNFPVDTGGQLTNTFKSIASRAFEWVRNDILKIRMELKYRSSTTNEYEDFVVYATNAWVMTGSGNTNVVMTIPTNGVMTGDNSMYWVAYVYPWDATNAWVPHQGFYTTDNDGANTNVSIAGIGLQILGITDVAYHGRDWDKWIAFNTRTQLLTMTYGIKDKGVLPIDEYNFQPAGTSGWSVTANTNIIWSTTSGALRATVQVGTGGYAYITRNGVALSNTNVTVECDMYIGNGAKDGGIIYGGRVLHINKNRIGWEDSSPAYTTSTNLLTGAWNRIILSVRDGAPYRNSDLYVNQFPMFRDEPIQVTNWTTNTVGFLSPYSNAASYVEWDNFRLVDEQYATVYSNVTGVSYPTNGLPTQTWPSVPDYDPDMWEHDGTTYGAKYDWFIYFRGMGQNVCLPVKVYMSPRLAVEQTNFPTVLNPGSIYAVPIDWENLGTNLPIYLEVRIEDPFAGTNYGKTVFTVTNATGGGAFNIAIPSSTPAGSNYLWLAYLYPTYATNPMLQRLGLDDTYRFTPEPFGVPVNPETRITVTSIQGSNYMIYTDAGIPAGNDFLTWAGFEWGYTGAWDSVYTNVSGIPEGTKCFRSWGNDYAGWGVFSTNGTVNLSQWSNGTIQFSVKSTQLLKMELEGPQGVKGTYFTNLPSTGNAWSNFSIKVTNFTAGGVVASNMFGLFMTTSPGGVGTTNYIDNIRWVK